MSAGMRSVGSGGGGTTVAAGPAARVMAAEVVEEVDTLLPEGPRAAVGALSPPPAVRSMLLGVRVEVLPEWDKAVARAPGASRGGGGGPSNPHAANTIE